MAKTPAGRGRASAMRIPWWAWAWPAGAWLILLLTPFLQVRGFVAAVAGAALIATVFAAVYHAEVVAHRTGEPFGTLVLAVAVTVIEVALIVSVMIAVPTGKSALARDTVCAAVMIVCNGIVGLCLLWGGARHHEQGFQVHGAGAALAVLAALTILTLILPNVATTAPGPYFSTSQLIFAGLISLLLYGSFVFVQTVRHRDYFLPANPEAADAHLPHPPPHPHAGERRPAGARPSPTTRRSAASSRRRRGCMGENSSSRRYEKLRNPVNSISYLEKDRFTSRMRRAFPKICAWHCEC